MASVSDVSVYTSAVALHRGGRGGGREEGGGVAEWRGGGPGFNSQRLVHVRHGGVAVLGERGARRGVRGVSGAPLPSPSGGRCSQGEGRRGRTATGSFSSRPFDPRDLVGRVRVVGELCQVVGSNPSLMLHCLVGNALDWSCAKWLFCRF